MCRGITLLLGLRRPRPSQSDDRRSPYRRCSHGWGWDPALRGFFDALVLRHVVVLNPAASIKAARYSVDEEGISLQNRVPPRLLLKYPLRPNGTSLTYAQGACFIGFGLKKRRLRKRASF